MQLWSSVIKDNLTFSQIDALILKEDCYATNTSYNCLYFYRNNIFYIINDDNKLFSNMPISSVNDTTSKHWLIVTPSDLALSYLRGFKLSN